MKKLLFILSLFLASVVQAQTNLDSLNTTWKDSSLAPSARAEALYILAQHFYYSFEKDSFLVIARQMEAFAADNSLPQYEGKASNLLGMAYKENNEYIKALNAYDAFINIDYEDSFLNKKYTAAGAINKGMVFQEMGMDNRAIENYTIGIDLSREIGEVGYLSSALGSIGQLYSKSNNLEKAMEYFTESLELQKSFGKGHNDVAVYMQISRLHARLGQYEEAIEYNEMAIQSVSDRNLLTKDGIELFIDKANFLISMGELAQAEELLHECIDLEKSYPKDKFSTGISLTFGKLFSKSEDYRKTDEWCKKALRTVHDQNLLVNKEICECLLNANKHLGNSDEALSYYEMLRIIDDSLKIGETGKTLQKMEFAKAFLADSLANAEKARLVKVAHLEEVRIKDRNRNYSLVAGLFFLLLAAGFFMRWRFVRKSKEVLQEEKDRSENLLLNILPQEIAKELIEKGRADARDFEMVSILFTDFKGFTAVSEKLSAQDLVSEINTCFEAFDGIMGKYGIEKIKTIGDAYMAAGGLPVPSDDSIKNTVLAALEMQSFIGKRKASMDADGKSAFEMRVGIHTGPVVAGIVGVKKFQYDIWGDTVNTASRMESHGEVAKVNISQATYELLQEDPQFTFESRGKIQAKGKGEIEMYFVSKN